MGLTAFKTFFVIWHHLILHLGDWRLKSKYETKYQSVGLVSTNINDAVSVW